MSVCSCSWPLLLWRLPLVVLHGFLLREGEREGGREGGWAGRTYMGGVEVGEAEQGLHHFGL